MPLKIAPARWLKLRNSALVRRSTNRCINDWWSVSEKPVFEVSRTALPNLRIGEPVSAIGDIGQGPHPSQSLRQRVEYVAVGSIEARDLPLYLSPQAGAGRLGVRCSSIVPSRRACSSCVVLRKSGIWQTSHNRIRLDRSRVRRMIISSVESWRRVVSSWLSAESRSPDAGGDVASERIRA